jgi:hypothetical protein
MKSRIRRRFTELSYASVSASSKSYLHQNEQHYLYIFPLIKIISPKNISRWKLKNLCGKYICVITILTRDICASSKKYISKNHVKALAFDMFFFIEYVANGSGKFEFLELSHIRRISNHDIKSHIITFIIQETSGNSKRHSKAFSWNLVAFISSISIVQQFFMSVPKTFYFCFHSVCSFFTSFKVQPVAYG